jgi:hypothetical protein
MSRKKRNKRTQRQPQPAKPKQPIKKTFSEDEKINIEIKNEETKKQLDEQKQEPVVELTSESQNKLKEAEAKNDLSKYWEFVQDINKRLETLISKTVEEKAKTTELNQEIEASKKDLDANKSELKNKLDLYNKKDKELTEREFALDNGEFTNVIRRLLDTIKDTEKKVFTDTENLFKELADFHKNNLDEFSKTIKDSFEYETKLNEIKRERKKFEVEKQIFEEDIKEEYEDKYSKELKIKTNELDRLNRKLNRIESENKELKQLFDNLQSAFESTDAQEILMQYSFLNSELENLKKELNERPEKHEFDSKKDQIEELLERVKELQLKIDEGELLELKQKLYNQDSYIIEINAYKNEIESAKVRETSLTKTINDLSKTIDQLKGETAKKADAFEFAKKCDLDKRILGFNNLEKEASIPNNLPELITYVQQRMAFNLDKPFYYSKETITIFLAGLHMSPISILQGISGTGKTSLPREFAKALINEHDYQGLDDDNQIKASYRICAIQSGWRDNMDLMGYYNSFEHKYKETDFFKALYLANQPKYKDTLFLIILDEMNLSRPEHYFADFLSLLEQSPDERFIDLTNTPQDVLPELIKGGKLRIPQNLRFIGTANHDETTLEFAPKTYDRSNLMEMPKNYPEDIKKSIKRTNSLFNITYSWLKDVFEKAEQQHTKSFNKFHDFINSDDFKLLLMDKGIGVGNRLEDQAKRFIGVFVEAGSNKDLDLAVASDHLITSRLFRSLKNRYDLDKNNLTSFKEEYVKIFETKFGSPPNFAKELLEIEISKK